MRNVVTHEEVARLSILINGQRDRWNEKTWPEVQELLKEAGFRDDIKRQPVKKLFDTLGLQMGRVHRAGRPVGCNIHSQLSDMAEIIHELANRVGLDSSDPIFSKLNSLGAEGEVASGQ